MISLKLAKLSSSLFVAVVVLLSGLSGKAQSGHSADIDWLTLKSDEVKIVFPNGFESQARQVLASVRKSSLFFNDSLSKRIRPIQMVLRSQQVQSNGYVGLGPLRSEFYLNPPQDFNYTGTGDWLDVLSVHEYRHVQQAMFIDKGVVKVFHYLFGQAGWAIGKTLAVPDWFFEGDAVVAETKYSAGGRGRLPSFFALQNAILSERGLMKYSLARNGSFKRRIPNEYLLGYTLCNYVNQREEDHVWARVLSQSASLPLFFPFTKSIRKVTGLKLKDIYQSSFEEIESSFSDKVLSEHQRFKRLSPENKVPANYSFPFYYENKLYALKTSFRHTPRLVNLSKSDEKTVVSPGISQETYVSSNGPMVCWTELSRNPRFVFEEYSDIILFDLRTSERRVLTKKKKYFSPHASENGQLIVAVYRDSLLQTAIHILDGKTGGLVENLSLHQFENISYPKWASQDKIVFLGRQQGKISIFEWVRGSAQITQLLPYTHHVINELNVCEEGLLFSSSASGIDNLFLFTPDQKLLQLTNSKTGLYTPTYFNGQILGSEVHSDGDYLVSSNPLALETTIPEYAEPLLDRSTLAVSQTLPTDSMHLAYTKPQAYNKISGLQLHSYLVEPSYVNPSFSLYFENLLSNVVGETNFTYNTNENKATWGANFLFSSSFPVFGVSTNATGRLTPLLNKENQAKNARFDERNFGVDMSVPLSYIRSNYLTSFLPQIRLQYKSLLNVPTEFSLADMPGFLNASLAFSVRNLRRTAYQNVRTRWGQEFSITLQKGLGQAEAKNLMIRSAFYFPGFFPNHSIKLDGQYRNEKFLNQYKYGDTFLYHRGGTHFASDQASRVSLEYMMPLWYPDFGILNLIYFKRISANFFFDYAYYSLGNAFQKANSSGVEINFDNIHYNEFPVSYGFRISLPDDVNIKQKVHFEILFGALF